MPKSIYLDEYRRIVDAIRDAREAAGLSQGELADRVRRSQQWMSLLERGSRRLDVVEFADICLALEVDPKALFEPMVNRLRANRQVRRSGRS